METTRSWRLSRRITRWCMAVGTGSVGLLAILGCILIHFETERFLDAIAEEELQEMIGGFAASLGRQEDFALTSDALQRSHPGDGMGWRVWRRADGTVWGSFGRPELVARIPATLGPEPELARSHRWLRGRLDEKLEVGLLLEGGEEVSSEHLFFLVAGSTVIVAAGLSFLAGRILGRRVGGSLRKIAEETRSAVHARDLEADLGDLPEEIEDVVAALRESLARIRAESDKARLLASGLAHELRSPLQNLLMQVEVALLRERAPADYAAAFARQLAELQELIRAVDNLVTLCAPPEALRARHGETFDLAAEARLRLATELARAAREHVRVELDFPSTLPVRGDRETLLLALRNVLANAIDWSPAGGRVDVRIGVAGGNCALEVDDQGPGVPPADRERIFRPFERGSRQPKGRIGYGLGLALVRAVADLHDGRVLVTDSPAGGARFRMEFPLEAAAFAGT